MPELPEVETTLQGILPHIKQQKIAKIIIRQNHLRWPIPLKLKKILRGQKITNIERRAKYILLTTTIGTIIIHLGMSGRLRILPEKTLANKHDHFEIVFKNKKIMRLTDPRRFGAVLWTEDAPHLHPLLKNLGIEPLSKNFNGKYLFLRAQKTNKAIKSVLMDSKIVTGIGNIYAAEALFAAGIYPATPAKILSQNELEKLAEAIKRILQYAIKQGGTTLKDFLDSNGKPGYFFLQLKVYGRAGEACVNCQTLLKNLKMNSRSSVFCPQCQPILPDIRLS